MKVNLLNRKFRKLVMLDVKCLLQILETPKEGYHMSFMVSISAYKLHHLPLNYRCSIKEKRLDKAQVPQFVFENGCGQSLAKMFHVGGTIILDSTNSLKITKFQIPTTKI